MSLAPNGLELDMILIASALIGIVGLCIGVGLPIFASHLEDVSPT